ncbi:MAG: M42 family metallopeptidase [Clostridiaceae bacterium]|nr:M42 family metallopeptidase [Clostridiaceae bacterium]
MFDIINKLTQTFGPSGNEKKVADLIRDMLKDKVDEVKTDVLGNLICIKKGSGKKIMLAAHMDEIGIIVSFIDKNGFLRFSNVGGLNPFVILGKRVIFENGSVGVVWYEENIDDIKNIKLEKMYIDIAASSKEDAERLVNVGDMAVFEAGTILQNGRIISKSMDNRIGCAVLVQTALNQPETENEIYYVFTAQEEVGLRGAGPAAYGLMPDMALAVDVTATGDTPECKPMAVKLGAGPAIKIKDRSVIAHPEVKDLLIKCAIENNIPHQFEILSQGGTDAGSIHTTAGGIPSGGVAIPTRNVHNSAEIVDMKDVENAVKLIEAFINQ